MAGKKAFDTDHALRSAMILFWLKGYEATSVPELAAAMGIGRQSLYDTFGSKHDLFMAALKLYCEVYAAALLEHVEAPGASLNEIQQYLEANIASYFARPGAKSCFMVNSTLELARRDPEVARYVRAFQRRIEKAVSNALANAVARGELSPEVSAAEGVHRLMALTLVLPVMIAGGTPRTAATGIVRSTLASIRA